MFAVEVIFSWQHPQHHQTHLDWSCLLAVIGWQLGVAGGWFDLGGGQAGLDLHEGGSWGGLGLI